MHLKADVINQYKPINESFINILLKEEIALNQKKIIVLDDDPTGVQTVHDVPVYTHWDKESVTRGFMEESNVFFILTNSRAFTEDETARAHQEIAAEAVAPRRTNSLPASAAA